MDPLSEAMLGDQSINVGPLANHSDPGNTGTFTQPTCPTTCPFCLELATSRTEPAVPYYFAAMVTTRRGALAAADDDSGSDDDNSIPRQLPVRRRDPAAGTPATLRPPRKPAPTRAGPTKRKRTSIFDSPDPPPKRPRRGSPVKDSIEVQADEDDDLVDAAISATGARPKSDLAVVLSSRKAAPKPSKGAASEPAKRAAPEPSKRAAPKPSTTSAPGPRLHLKSLGHNINSREIITRRTVRETPEPESHTRPAHEEESSDEAQGSPELQSSALKRRRAKPPADVYALPEDEEPEARSPAALRGPTTINGLERLSRSNKGKKPAPKVSSRQTNTRLSSIREEELQPQPSSRDPPPHASHEPRPPRQNPSEHSFSFDDEDDDFEESEETRSAVFEEELAVVIEVRRYDPSEPTISVLSDHINEMAEVMGKSAWTGDGRRWRAEILQHGEQTPARTKVGKAIFKSLGSLEIELDDVPNALDLVGQERALAKQSRALNVVMSSVEDSVARIMRLAAPAGPSQQTIRFLTALASDLSTFVIPMLVLALQTAFDMGIDEPDAEVRDALPQEGVFTSTTVRYMQWISSWLFRLEKVLAEDLGERTGQVAHASQEQSRQKFGVIVRKWMQHLKEGINAFNKKSDRDREIYAMRQRDLAIKAQKRALEEQDIARSRTQDEAFRLSLQRISSQPRPMAEKFRKATAHWNWDTLDASTPPPNAVTQRPLPLPNAALHPRSRPHDPSAPGVPAPAPAALPPPVPDYPPWPEDEVRWFLGELKRPDRSRGYLEVCAEALERPLEEVKMERERLVTLGRYSSPGRGR